MNVGLRWVAVQSSFLLVLLSSVMEEATASSVYEKIEFLRGRDV